MASADPQLNRLSPNPVHTVRIASGAADMKIVRQLDDAAFPEQSLDQERAHPGELEDGVGAGDIYLLERNGEPVAYLHMDRSRPDRFYASGLAVHPSVQNMGLGKYILRAFVHAVEAQLQGTPVVTVTSPRNHPMLALLFGHGFVGRWLLRDFFGPGRHRLGLQTARLVPPGDALVQLPTEPLGAVFRLMDEGFLIRGLVRGLPVPHFLMSPEHPGEFLPCGPPIHGSA